MPNIPARIKITGLAHRVELAKTKPSDPQKAPQDCARVTVLTDGGGFLEVYYGPEAFHAVPAERGALDITCDVAAYVKTSDAGRPWAFLDVRCVPEQAVAVTAAPLHSVPSVNGAYDPVG